MQNTEIEMPWEPPYSPVAERAVLGSILLDNDALELAAAIITPDAMTPDHDLIMSTCQSMRDEGVPIDLATLTARLQAKGKLERIGGVGYLSSLVSEVPTAGNVEFYAKEVRHRLLLRMGYDLARKILETAKTTASPSELAAQMEAAAAVMSDQTASGQDFRSGREVIMEAYDQLEQRANSPATDGVTGVPTGYADLDKMTAGFQRSDLIIIAARPSVGKTAFALNIAQHAAIRAGENVAVFSLEQSASQLAQRMMAAEGNVDATRIRTGRLGHDDWTGVTHAVGAIADAKLFIDDTPGISVSEIRAKCRRLKKKVGSIGLILIDYLQLVTLRHGKENRVQEVSEISRQLKQLAREMDAPVVALSQLSRKVEDRQDKRPMMSDLRESGSIEQDADIVGFLYRDDYYDKESEKKNIIEIIIAKQRNGPVGTVELAFLKHFSKFVSLMSGHNQPPRRDDQRPIPDMHRQL